MNMGISAGPCLCALTRHEGTSLGSRARVPVHSGKALDGTEPPCRVWALCAADDGVLVTCV